MCIWNNLDIFRLLVKVDVWQRDGRKPAGLIFIIKPIFVKLGSLWQN